MTTEPRSPTPFSPYRLPSETVTISSSLVVRFAVQIRRFQMYHGGVFCDTLLTVFVQKLNVIQRFAEILLQRFVSADVQYIFTA